MYFRTRTEHKSFTAINEEIMTRPDGYTDAELGIEIIIGWWIFKKTYKLTAKYRTKKGWNKCPICNSKNTFHHQRQKEMGSLHKRMGIPYSNCFVDMHIDSEGHDIITVKKDICLNCGHTFVVDIFCWDKKVK